MRQTSVSTFNFLLKIPHLYNLDTFHLHGFDVLITKHISEIWKNLSLYLEI